MASSVTTRTRPVPYRISVGVGTGSLLQPLNSSMIAVALVTIGTQLGISLGISWLISALYLATAVGAPTAGRLADLFGARKVYFCGLVLVALGGLLGAVMSDLPGLILARVVLGLGTASQYPAAMRSSAPVLGDTTRTPPKPWPYSGSARRYRWPSVPPWVACWSPALAGGPSSGSTFR